MAIFKTKVVKVTSKKEVTSIFDFSYIFVHKVRNRLKISLVLQGKELKKFMMTIYKLSYLMVLLLVGVVYSPAQTMWQSKLVQENKSGLLSYIPDKQGNTIPDFSKVGYFHGKKDVPFVSVVKTLTPSSNSNYEINNAIEALAAMPLDKNGFRGAILLKKGVYKVQSINILVSGIVLRGEGEETIIVAAGNGQRSLIVANGTGSFKEIKKSRTSITDRYVAVGAKSFTVANANEYKVGDKIIVYRPGTQQWISDLRMDQIEVRDTSTKQWQPNSFHLQFERAITRIDGNTIFIDNPIVMALEEQYGGGEIYKYNFDGRINNVGIENLSCESEYENDEDENYGWNAIDFNKIENGWVRSVTAKYFGYSCVNLGSFAKNITVDWCKSLDPKSKITGGRRYSFNNDGQQNLVMNCFASNGRHDYVTGAKVCGPNVFYNCKAEKTHADIGPHHRWSTGTLYDNIVTDGEINIQDRGNWGTGHGWVGVTQVVWNCIAAKAAIQNPCVSGINYVVGLKAVQQEGRLKGRTLTIWENEKGTLQPASLFKAQLAESLK